MTNLLQETLEFLRDMDKTPADVCWVGDHDSYYSWDEFATKANIEYDEGFGAYEIDLALKVVGKDWWLERHEYDGSEWWEYKELPEKPTAKGNVKITTEYWKT